MDQYNDETTSKNQSLLLGGFLVTFAMFGIGKEFNYFAILNWFDGLIICTMSAASIMWMTEKKWWYAFLSVVSILMLLAYSYEKIKFDLGLTLFGVLFLLGVSLLTKSFRQKDKD